MGPEEIASTEFTVAVRGYFRDGVRAFLLAVAVEFAERDARIAEREHQLARCRRELAKAKTVDRGSLLRRLGEETAATLEAAEASAARTRAQAEGTAEQVRRELQTVAARLGDLRQSFGALVSRVTGIIDEVS